MITEKDEIINRDLIKRYSQFQSLCDMQKKLSKTQNAQENEKPVKEIRSRMIDLNNETIKMSKNQNEKANEIMDVVAEILDFKEQYQQGRGLKILTPQEMLSRLPISLAQLKAGNNSEKLKNEIRQL